MENNKSNDDNKKAIDRRNFLTSSALSTAGLVAGSSFLSTVAGAHTTKKNNTTMNNQNGQGSLLDFRSPKIYVMGLGSINIAERKVQQHGAPVYLYNFGYQSEAKVSGTDYPFGTPHAMDIMFKFNNEVPGMKEDLLSGNKPERFTASRNMAELWTSFARRVYHLVKIFLSGRLII